MIFFILNRRNNVDVAKYNNHTVDIFVNILIRFIFLLSRCKIFFIYLDKYFTRINLIIIFIYILPFVGTDNRIFLLLLISKIKKGFQKNFHNF